MKMTALAVLTFALSLPAAAGVLYDNGPMYEGDDGYDLYHFCANWGCSDNRATDSFTLNQASVVTGFQLGLWTLREQFPVSVDWAITMTVWGTPIASGTGDLSSVAVSQQPGAFWWTYYSWISGVQVSLPAGDYWLELSNGINYWTPVQDFRIGVYWDINGGPSDAYLSLLGPYDSESFAVLGYQTPEPGSLSLAAAGLYVLYKSMRGTPPAG